MHINVWLRLFWHFDCLTQVPILVFSFLLVVFITTWAPSQYKDHLPRYGDSCVKDKMVVRPEIPMLVRRHLYIEMAPCIWYRVIDISLTVPYMLWLVCNCQARESCYSAGFMVMDMHLCYITGWLEYILSFLGVPQMMKYRHIVLHPFGLRMNQTFSCFQIE